MLFISKTVFGTRVVFVAVCCFIIGCSQLKVINAGLKADNTPEKGEAALLDESLESLEYKLLLNPQDVKLKIKLLKLRYDGALFHYNKAKNLYANGSKESAISHLNKALSYKPEFQPAKKLLEKISLKGKAGISQQINETGGTLKKQPASGGHESVLFTINDKTEESGTRKTRGFASAAVVDTRPEEAGDTTQSASQAQNPDSRKMISEAEKDSDNLPLDDFFTASVQPQELQENPAKIKTDNTTRQRQTMAAKLSVYPPNITVSRGEKLTVEVMAQNVMDLYSVPFYLEYNPGMLTLLKVSEGTFLRSDGEETIFISSAQPQNGRVVIGLSRKGNIKGITGSGTIARFEFLSTARGNSSLKISNIHMSSSNLLAMPVPESIYFVNGI